jgi:hypothetical protein
MILADMSASIVPYLTNLPCDLGQMSAFIPFVCSGTNVQVPPYPVGFRLNWFKLHVLKMRLGTYSDERKEERDRADNDFFAPCCEHHPFKPWMAFGLVASQPFGDTRITFLLMIGRWEFREWKINFDFSARLLWRGIRASLYSRSNWWIFYFGFRRRSVVFPLAYVGTQGLG